MATEILMPALSPTMTEGNLVTWLKKEGDKIEAGDVLAEIETDKATMEVEAVDDGILAKILVPAGSQKVRVNTVIAQVLEEGDTPQDLAMLSSTDTHNADAASTQATIQPDISTPVTPDTAPHSPPLMQQQTQIQTRIMASPLAKRLAEQNQISLENLEGSGPHGRIIKADIDAAIAATAQKNTPTPPMTACVISDVACGAPEKRPLSGMRTVIAQRLTESKQQIPHFYLSVSCVLEPLLAARKKMNKTLEEQNIRLSVNDFIIKATAMALKKVPDANVTWGGDHLLHHKTADVAVAVSVEGGLYTPLIKQAELKSLSQISTEMKTLAAKARSGKLLPEEYQGGSFSVSNLGMFGVESFSAIINPPQACILAVGAGIPTVIPIDGIPSVRTIMTCTLSVDHRAVDGALGAQWLKAFKAFIEDPVMMLA